MNIKALSWKWLTVSLVVGVIGLSAVGVAWAADRSAQSSDTAGITIPVVNVEVGVESPARVWMIDRQAEEKWTLSLEGVQTESLSKPYHGCGLDA